jgi:hypothetical protein
MMPLSERGLSAVPTFLQSTLQAVRVFVLSSCQQRVAMCGLFQKVMQFIFRDFKAEGWFYIIIDNISFAGDSQSDFYFF